MIREILILVKMPDTWTPDFDLSDAEAVAKQNDEAKSYIDSVIEGIRNTEVKISGAYGEKITANQLYKVLLNFDKMYFRMTDAS